MTTLLETLNALPAAIKPQPRLVNRRDLPVLSADFDAARSFVRATKDLAARYRGRMAGFHVMVLRHDGTYECDYSIPLRRTLHMVGALEAEKLAVIRAVNPVEGKPGDVPEGA